MTRVLVADDDVNLVEVLKANLEAEGYEVEVARDGHQALACIAAQLPDLVVLDVMMPGRDGLDVLSTLRDDPTTRGLPVVLLTARAGDEEIWAGWQAGANYYMTKPFEIDQLLQYLRYLSGELSATLPT